MSSRPLEKGNNIQSFRAKLLVAMTLVVFAITGFGLYVAQRKVVVETEHDLQRDFQNALVSLHTVQQVREAALAERCRALAGRPRIHAALEDNALDLLYPSAKDELHDVMAAVDDPAGDEAAHVLRARFYRFLDATGAVISPPNLEDVGALSPDEEAEIALHGTPQKQHVGYLIRRGDAVETLDEVIVKPILSSETGEVISAIVLGFKPAELGGDRLTSGIKSGIWLNGQVHLLALPSSVQTMLAQRVNRALATPGAQKSSLRVEIDHTPHLLFYKHLNPGSVFPPAYEVCIYSLADLLVRQQQLRWQAAFVCALLLLGGLAASHFLSARLAVPVEKLAVDSEKNRAQRERAEAALEVTSEELQRAARFSADASHQLKTPVTVLRAGLDELLARENFSPETRDEISTLVHQTYRLTSIIEDLLLLSRMDAGRLEIEFHPVNLSQLIEGMIDDLSALPDGLNLDVEMDCPRLHVAGEKRYVALILQNLLENARKYNRPNGHIRIACREDGDWAVLTIGNTGRPIPCGAREHIFERFHRGAIGENVPGHGLGLNLARELARLHGGDLRLSRSDEDWTEFELRFRVAKQPQLAAAGAA